MGLLWGVVWGHFEGILGDFWFVPWGDSGGTLGVTLGILLYYFEGTLRVVLDHYEGTEGQFRGTLGSL